MKTFAFEWRGESQERSWATSNKKFWDITKRRLKHQNKSSKTTKAIAKHSKSLKSTKDIYPCYEWLLLCMINISRLIFKVNHLHFHLHIFDDFLLRFSFILYDNSLLFLHYYLWCHHDWLLFFLCRFLSFLFRFHSLCCWLLTLYFRLLFFLFIFFVVDYRLLYFS